MTHRYYIVTATAATPACGESDSTFRLFARDRADAIKQARAQVRRNGYTRQDGPTSYRCKLDETQDADAE